MLKQLSQTEMMAVETILRNGNRDSRGVDTMTELMYLSTACLGARKVPADNPIVHGVGEPCKVHQDWIYIQVKVKPVGLDGSK
jgi:hypothetical protein